MIKTIFSAFAVYGALSSASTERRLLQATPAFVPVDPAVVPAPAPAPEVVIPSPSTPAGPPEWTPVVLPDPALTAHQHGKECVLANTEVGTCAGTYNTFRNFVHTFAAKCSGRGSCAQSTWDFIPSAFTERVEQINFSAEYAGYQATIIMEAPSTYIDKLEFTENMAGLGCRVYLIGGASVNDVDCSRANYCPDCFIQDGCTRNPDPADPNDPNGPRGKPICLGPAKPCFRY